MYSSEHTSKVGPRAKCDQVVYEAIAKAAEIIVRGRCECQNQRQGGGAGATNTTGSSISRFHLEVEEVPLVRNILQMWRKCLHVPLRLDVYYEYCTDPAQPEKTTRKELLERWCIDYLPDNTHLTSENSTILGSPSMSSTSSSSSIISTSGRNGQRHYHPQQHVHSHHQRSPKVKSTYNHGHQQHQQHHDETIAQLRQVVKRVVILLRVLHSQTRLMPAYRLHHALMEDLQHLNYNRPLGSGPGLGGGYYHPSVVGAEQRPHSRGQDFNGMTPSSPSNASARARDSVGGRINYSFYVSDSVSSGGEGTSDSTATLFSSSTNSPFARHDLSPIPTPFGLLRFSALYDESLDVERVLMDRARRILNLGFGQQYQQGQFAGDTPKNSRARAIPIKSESNHNVGNESFSQRYVMNIDRPRSADPSRHEMRDRLGSDPGQGLGQNTEKRVLSGLSLALMNEEAKTPQADNTTSNLGIESATPPSPLLRPAVSNDSASNASLKQRLAFHHPPPSFNDQGLGQAAQNPLHGRVDSPSPMPMSNTPPQPMFIGSFPRSLGALRPGTPKDPPFCNPTTLLPSGDSSSSTIPAGNSTIPNATVIQGNSTLLPPLNSQDALASNPFKSSVAQSMISTNLSKEMTVGSANASAFSSLVLGKGSAVYGPGDEGFPLALTSESSSLIPGRFSSDYLSRSGNVFSNLAANREEDADDMPFVVELESSENEGGAISNISTPKLSRQNSAIDMSTTSSGTMSSQVVSSLAHRCSTAGRLRMFSENGQGASLHTGKPVADEDITNLTNQLADFRSFGESITSSGPAPGGK